MSNSKQTHDSSVRYSLFDIRHYSLFAIRHSPAGLRALTLIGLLLAFPIACRKEQSETAPGPGAPGSTMSQPEKPDPELIFPDSMRVDDPAVNQFVERVLADCAGGEYRDFRLLWSAREEPITRDAFEERWSEIEKIEIRALKEVILARDSDAEAAGSDIAYALWMDVSVRADPRRGTEQQEQPREVILACVAEQQGWRLARAPKALRKWVNEQVSKNRTSPSPPKQSANDVEPGE